MLRKKPNNNIYLDFSVQHDGRLRQAQLKMVDMLVVIDQLCQRHSIEYWLDRGSLLGAVRHQGFIPWDDDIDIAMPRASYDAFLAIAPQELPSHLWVQTVHSDPGYFNLAAPLKIRDLNSRFIEKHEKGTEPYQQGIFIDVFPYDVMPNNALERKFYKFLGKKLWRLLSHKYGTVVIGSHAEIYQMLGYLVSKTTLENALKYLIQHANQQNSTYLGYGYDSTKNIALSKQIIYPLKRMRFETAELNVVNDTDAMLTQIYGDYLTLPPEHKRKLNHCKELIPHFEQPLSLNR